MELTVGQIVEGKVKTITNFGAFIALDHGKTGMVHISDIANAYVNDIHDFLTEGQDVKAMVINVDGGKIGLSIKRLEARPAPRPQNPGAPRRPAANRTPRPVTPPPAPKTADQLFEEKLKAFMSESDSKISSLRSEHRTRSRRR